LQTKAGYAQISLLQMDVGQSYVGNRQTMQRRLCNITDDEVRKLSPRYFKWIKKTI